MIFDLLQIVVNIAILFSLKQNLYKETDTKENYNEHEIVWDDIGEHNEI